MEDLKVRKMLLALSLQNGGDYERTMAALMTYQFPSVEEIEAAESKIKCQYITFIDPEYPKALQETFHPPVVLYYYGDISLLDDTAHTIAVIGSRDASDLGINKTTEMVKELVPDYTIVSGMARGIDTAAHISALNNKGKTIAVLGCGIDYCYPPENYDLYKILKKKGLVISEYPSTTPPEADNFPRRNRIIAGLAKGILITEAKRRSGTLITVHFAQSMTKEVMCVPYRTEDESGCNQLIKEGAYMVEDSDDVRLVMDGTRNLKKTLMWP